MCRVYQIVCPRGNLPPHRHHLVISFESTDEPIDMFVDHSVKVTRNSWLLLVGRILTFPFWRLVLCVARKYSTHFLIFILETVRFHNFRPYSLMFFKLIFAISAGKMN
jgi:hypothetical protein